MSRFRYVILPRLLLALSALALLAALFLLWLSLERPLPSIALACRQAGPANCFTGGEVIASGPIRLNYAEPDADAWAVLRSGDQYAMTNLKRTAGVLWTVPQFSLALFSLEDGQQLFPCPTGSFPYYFYREGTDSWGGPYFEPEIDWEIIPLAICTNPSVVRLEGEVLWLGFSEDPQEALAQRGVSISWSPAGNGVWVGEPVLTSLPTEPDGSGSGIRSFWLRGYDAGGNLVCSYDPAA